MAAFGRQDVARGQRLCRQILALDSANYWAKTMLLIYSGREFNLGKIVRLDSSSIKPTITNERPR